MSEHLASALAEWSKLVEPIVSHSGEALLWIEALLSQPELASAFCAGALALAIGARLSIIGGALVAGVWVANAVGIVFDPNLVRVLVGLSGWLVALGAVQGIATLAIGKEAAGSFIGAITFGVFFWVVWKAPAKLMRSLWRRR